MKVATWHGGSRFTIDTVPDPSPGPGDVVVAVHTATICGSDIHAVQGLFPRPVPMVLGHEYSGVVRAVGRGVPKSLIGRAVACEGSYGCGTCADCKAGREVHCTRCVRVGGFAEYAAMPARYVHRLPRGLDPVTAAIAEPASCCLSALDRVPVARGATCVVIGGGVMGLLTMLLAKARGARRFIVSDPLEERRRMARRLGAQVVVDPRAEPLRDRVLKDTHGVGAELVCEAVGTPELVAQAVALARPGGSVVLIGVSPKGTTLTVDLWDIQTRELVIGGAFGRGTAFTRTLRLLPKLGVKSLVTGRFPLEKIAEAFEHAAAGKGGRTAIAPGAA